jgi:hypothetical protein
VETDPQNAIDALSSLLAPLGDRRRKKILQWVEQEIATHAMVSYVEEAGAPITTTNGEETGGPQEWRIGEKSPLNAQETIFAMFIDDANVVSAYSFQSVEVDGKEAVFFFRALIFKPVHVHGPVHHNALIHELEQFIGPERGGAEPDEPDEPEARANGNATA